MVTGVLGFVLLRRFHLINVAPVSYSLVVHEMLDAIIVLDARAANRGREPGCPSPHGAPR